MHMLIHMLELAATPIAARCMPPQAEGESGERASGPPRSRPCGGRTGVRAVYHVSAIRRGAYATRVPAAVTVPRLHDP